MFKTETIWVRGSAYDAAKRGVKRQAKNIRVIGTGAFAAVWGAKNSPVVFKVGDYYDNDGYLAYIKELAKSRKHNPFTPRIYGMWIFRNKNDSSDAYFVVAIERLESGYKRNGFTWAVEWLEDMVYTFNKNNSRNKEKEILNKFFGIKQMLPKNMPKDLVEVAEMLKRAYKKSGADWDIHTGNCMMRGNQLVITDPLA